MKRVPHRRRREKKTDYRKRLKLLKSGKIRLVVRKSLKHMRVQFIEYAENGDRVVASAFSKELEKMGWKWNCGNVPAAYLTGLLAGIRAAGKIKEAILDTGLQVSTKGSRIYAALKGVLDSGIHIPHSPEILPSEDRILGKHINEKMERDVNELKKSILGGKQ
ncbi:MAG: 50S ribosomal protein L18 [Candidatus Micrarchaeota archaeon]|nr:50S ribosomal protein L18 [Candidatus Micrarchaeota archaeon]